MYSTLNRSNADGFRLFCENHVFTDFPDPDSLQFPSVQSVEPIRSPFAVSLRLPSSKSITLRQLVVSALAPEKSTLIGFDRSDDVDAMIDCLRRLGIEFRIADASCHVDPTGFNLKEDIELDPRMSGLTLRLLLAVAVLRSGTTSFNGSDSLKARPNSDLLDAIRTAWLHRAIGIRVPSNNHTRTSSITQGCG